MIDDHRELLAQQIRAVSLSEDARRDFEAAALREEANPTQGASAGTPAKPAAKPAAPTYEYAVEQETNRLRIHAAAALALRQERAGAQPQPALTRLDA